MNTRATHHSNALCRPEMTKSQESTQLRSDGAKKNVKTRTLNLDRRMPLQSASFVASHSQSLPFRRPPICMTWRLANRRALRRWTRGVGVQIELLQTSKCLKTSRVNRCPNSFAHSRASEIATKATLEFETEMDQETGSQAKTDNVADVHGMPPPQSRCKNAVIRSGNVESVIRRMRTMTGLEICKFEPAIWTDVNNTDESSTYL
jgi:hypothetical protein